MDWQTIRSAPFDRDLELAVIDMYGPHTLVFPCRRILRGWVKAATKEQVDVHPTHWREWQESKSVLFSIAPPFQLRSKQALDSSLRDVKEDDSNNEVAPSRGGEQIDDVLDGFAGGVVGGFKSAVWAILRVRTAVEAAVGKWSAQPFVEEQKKQRDLNTL